MSAEAAWAALKIIGYVGGIVVCALVVTAVVGHYVSKR